MNKIEVDLPMKSERIDYRYIYKYNNKLPKRFDLMKVLINRDVSLKHATMVVM